MRYELTPDQAFFHETTRRFLDAEMPTTEVRALHHVADGFDRGWWRRGAELGWTSLLVDAVHGGGSLSADGLADLVIVAEEFGRHVAPGPLVPCNLVAAALSRFADEATRTGWLPGLLDGSVIGAWAGAGPAATTVTATIGEGGSAARLDGVVDVVEAGAQADVILVSAHTSGTSRERSPRLFVVDARAEGCRASARNGLDLVRRHGSVELHSAAGTDLGAGPDGVAWLRRVALLLQCAEMAGATAKVFEFTLRYAFDRYSFGRPLASYQALKHRFADMAMHVEACHAICDAAVLVASPNIGGDPERAAELEAERFASAAKAYVAARAPEIVQDCVQMHGGIGVTWEHDIHLYLRRVTANAGLLGNGDIHRERVGALMAATCGSDAVA